MEFWTMQYTTLGRTGLRVSVMGLGCGGPSQLGQRTGKTRAESVRVVREALDLGVNLLDTAEQYVTEDIVGEALREVPREDVVLCTKRSTWDKGTPPPTAEVFTASLEASLKRLRTDYVDVYYLHGIRPAIYTDARDALVPVLRKLRDQGKIRFIGLTEAFELDPAHGMVQDAFKDGCWEVMMIGFNILHQTARRLVFPETIRQNIGTVIMFAIRRALSRPKRLREVLADLRARGRIDSDVLTGDDPLGFLVNEYGAASVQDAAYRFCRHEPGVNVVLAGTGEVDHLRMNAESINRPDLPPEARRLLERLFANADDAVGD
jgi:aryl-alcohol dehydrogenase-like predicted oxidoreductase